MTNIDDMIAGIEGQHPVSGSTDRDAYGLGLVKPRSSYDVIVGAARALGAVIASPYIMLSAVVAACRKADVELGEWSGGRVNAGKSSSVKVQCETLPPTPGPLVLDLTELRQRVDKTYREVVGGASCDARADAQGPRATVASAARPVWEYAGDDAESKSALIEECLAGAQEFMEFASDMWRRPCRP